MERDPAAFLFRFEPNTAPEVDSIAAIAAGTWGILHGGRVYRSRLRCSSGKVGLQALSQCRCSPGSTARTSCTASARLYDKLHVINTPWPWPVPKATWIVKVGDGMPSSINVQGQVQMATTCIPDNGPDTAAYRIQSVFFAPADVCSMAHIADAIQGDVTAMINEMYPVLRNIDSPLFKVLRPVIECVTDLRDSGLEIAHLEVVPFENGVYFYSTQSSDSSAYHAPNSGNPSR